ncbi:MAG: PepSY domain-containing protein [Cyanobacterium sp. T60_A2020_053]|nr:PepSY domain-containing protein [Cyanobacterium sp. T60_A2020_053]
MLQIYQRNNTFDPIFIKFHTELLAGIIGKTVLGFVGISLFLLTITGLLLWNGWQKLALGFKIRFGSKWRLLNYDIHKVIGILSFIFVANFAITGAILALDKPSG